MQSGSVVVNTVECNSPDSVLSTALDESISEQNYGVFKAKVPMAKFRNAMDDVDSEEGGGQGRTRGGAAPPRPPLRVPPLRG